MNASWRPSWTTESETENLGFHIYRSLGLRTAKEQISKKLIDGAVNSQTRHDYEFEDRTIEENTTYYYWLADISLDGLKIFHGPRKVATVAKPQSYGLTQNYPNPFNSTTSLTYSLKEDGVASLKIYNIRGQLVRELVNVKKPAGIHSAEWDGRDNFGMVVPTGTYLYVLDVNGFKSVRKMAFMK